MMGAGLYVEECLQEIVGRFLSAVTAELKFQEASLRLAAPILLRDLARSLRSPAPAPEPWLRSMTLVLSQPAGGVRGLMLEFGLLRAALWDTLAARGHAVPSIERRAVDRFLDEAAASAADRWATYARLLVPTSMRERPASPVPPPVRPPPLPKKAAR
ncbi:MAG: hypothetical protein QM765_48955 [Myxococcales bacterium]